MKRYGNLYERVIDRENIRAAVLAAARRKRARRPVGDAQRAIAIAGVMSHASCDRIRRERIDRYVSIDKMKEIVRNGI